MKTFLIATLFACPSFAQAQDSCQLKQTTDPFTHQTKISTGFIPFVANGVQLSISVDASSTEVDYFLWFTGPQKCFDETSTVQVNFTGERTRLMLRNSGSTNCEGAFHFTFKNAATTPSQLKRLATKMVSNLHFTGTGKTVTDVSFTPEQQQKLMQMTECVVNASKSLLKK